MDDNKHKRSITNLNIVHKVRKHPSLNLEEWFKIKTAQ